MPGRFERSKRGDRAPEGIPEWFQLLKFAVDVLEKTGINRDMWTWGGGSALAYRFRHRRSRDIDIFLKDVQLLPALSPRVNPHLEGVDFAEMANWLKLKLGEMELDFIVAPNLTGLAPSLEEVHGLTVYVEHPVEIMTKKLFYRSESLKARDLVDLAVVLRECPPGEIDLLLDVVESRADVLTDRIRFLLQDEGLRQEIGAMEAALSPEAVVEAARGFLDLITLPPAVEKPLHRGG